MKNRAMSSPRSGRRRVTRLISAEDEALDQIAREAEARLAARRQARAEAREIRMRELEKQQREADEQSDRHYGFTSDPIRPPGGIRENRSLSMLSGGSSYASSRRSSEDLSDIIDNRDLRHHVSEIEEKFRRAMIATAQLDNEKTSLSYYVDALRDEVEELEELYLQSQRDHREICRLHDLLGRDFKTLKEENEFLQENIKQRDELIMEHGLVLVGGEDEDELLNGDLDDEDEEPNNDKEKTEKPIQPKEVPKMALVSQEASEILKQAGKGSLDVRLKRFAEEKQELLDEIYRLRLDLEEEKQKTSKMESLTLHTSKVNGPEMKLLEVQREASKQVGEFKYQLKKAEQDVTTLQSNVARLEGQVVRFKAAAESAEAVEGELKAEKRKLLRELREVQSRVEELETANAHLQKRIDKLKISKNALIKA